MIKLTLENLEDFTRGTAFLGTGGGGDPYIGKLMLKHQLELGKKIEIITQNEISDDIFACNVLSMGAPTVFVEKVPNGPTTLHALREVEKIIGKKFNAIMPIEAGGVNATLPLVVSALSGLPVIDADGMGRAFPELQMVTYNVGDVDINPIVAINDFYETSKLDEEVMKLAETIASKSTKVVKIGKEAFYKQLEMPLDQAYKYTSEIMSENMMAVDAKEGISAFLEKRTPNWKNK